MSDLELLNELDISVPEGAQPDKVLQALVLAIRILNSMKQEIDDLKGV